MFTFICKLGCFSKQRITINDPEVAEYVYSGQYLSGWKEIVDNDETLKQSENFINRLYTINIDSAGKTHSIAFDVFSSAPDGNIYFYSISIDTEKGSYMIYKTVKDDVTIQKETKGNYIIHKTVKDEVLMQNTIIQNEIVSINTFFEALEQVNMAEIVKLSQVKSDNYSTFSRIIPPNSAIGTQHVSFPAYYISEGDINTVHETFTTNSGGILLHLIPQVETTTVVTFFFFSFSN